MKTVPARSEPVGFAFWDGSTLGPSSSGGPEARHCHFLLPPPFVPHFQMGGSQALGPDGQEDLPLFKILSCSLVGGRSLQECGAPSGLWPVFLSHRCT